MAAGLEADLRPPAHGSILRRRSEKGAANHLDSRVESVEASSMPRGGVRHDGLDWPLWNKEIRHE
jgi:hypothetical protein